MANIPNALAALASAAVSKWSEDEDDWPDTTEEAKLSPRWSVALHHYPKILRLGCNAKLDSESIPGLAFLILFQNTHC